MQSDHRIALYGRSGSGKSRIARHLEQMHGFSHVSTGALCREITARLFGDEDRVHLNLISQKLREINPNIWIDAVLRESIAPRIVFDSVRYPSDADHLRSLKFEIWHIFCPKDICERRLLDRGQRFTRVDLQHGTENALQAYPFDIVIDNGTRPVSDVFADVDSALEK